MMVCFEKNLSQDWHRVLHCLKDMDIRGEGGIALWDFLDFVVSFRTPLFIQMRPFILTKVGRIYINVLFTYQIRKFLVRYVTAALDLYF